MHDIADLESRGIPAAGVATTEFIAAAQAQAKSLGYSPTLVYVPHPVQDRTDQEVIALADAAFEDILAAITAADTR